MSTEVSPMSLFFHEEVIYLEDVNEDDFVGRREVDFMARINE